MARPSKFTQALANVICRRLMAGESMRQIVADTKLPAQSTVYKWLAEQEPFSEQYARAREIQADTHFDEILEIADDATKDRLEKIDEAGKVIGYYENTGALRRSAMRIEVRKYRAEKMAPKKYGPKVDLTSDGPIQVFINK
jgi:hypothetical protein